MKRFECVIEVDEGLVANVSPEVMLAALRKVFNVRYEPSSGERVSLLARQPFHVLHVGEIQQCHDAYRHPDTLEMFRCELRLGHPSRHLAHNGEREIDITKDGETRAVQVNCLRWGKR